VAWPARLPEDPIQFLDAALAEQVKPIFTPDRRARATAVGRVGQLPDAGRPAVCEGADWRAEVVELEGGSSRYKKSESHSDLALASW
jgi:hypothetical protein